MNKPFQVILWIVVQKMSFLFNERSCDVLINIACCKGKAAWTITEVISLCLSYNQIVILWPSSSIPTIKMIKSHQIKQQSQTISRVWSWEGIESCSPAFLSATQGCWDCYSSHGQSMVRAERQWRPTSAPTKPAKRTKVPREERDPFLLLALPRVDTFCSLSARQAPFYSLTKTYVC